MLCSTRSWKYSISKDMSDVSKYANTDQGTPPWRPTSKARGAVACLRRAFLGALGRHCGLRTPGSARRASARRLAGQESQSLQYGVVVCLGLVPRPMRTDGPCETSGKYLTANGPWCRQGGERYGLRKIMCSSCLHEVPKYGTIAKYLVLSMGTR